MTDRPSTIATDRPELTMIFPTGAFAAKWALKWFWLVFIVSRVNHVLSAGDRAAQRVLVDVSDDEILVVTPELGWMHGHFPIVPRSPAE
ncbi:hypothetical protein HerbRD11066_57450 [Herbidospora sp. RD11066]